MTRYFKLESDHPYIITRDEFLETQSLAVDKITQLEKNWGLKRGELAVWGTDIFGIQSGTHLVKDAETAKQFTTQKKYESRLTYHILRKNSKLAKEASNFEGLKETLQKLSTQRLPFVRFRMFGSASDGRRGNVTSFEEIQGSYYVSFDAPENALNKKESKYLEEIQEADYLRMMADKLDLDKLVEEHSKNKEKNK